MVVYKFQEETQDPIHGRSYVYDLHYHIVWVTKYRNPALTDEIQKALKDKLLTIAQDTSITLKHLN